MARYSIAKQRQFWREVEDSSRSPSEKGQALENLSVYLIERVPGVSIIGTNVVSASGSEEIDIGVNNLRRSRRGFFFLPFFFLVECKNWVERVGSAQVAWFDRKIELRGQSFGILVAPNGITGDPAQITDANEIVAAALHADRQLLVLTKDDIFDLAETQDFVRIIETRLGELILRRAAI